MLGISIEKERPLNISAPNAPGKENNENNNRVVVRIKYIDSVSNLKLLIFSLTNEELIFSVR